MRKLRPRKWGSAWECPPHPGYALILCVCHRCSTERMSERAKAESPAPRASSKLEAAQPTARLPSEVSSSAVTSQEQQSLVVPPHETPRAPGQSPEEPFPQPETLENAHPSKEELFFRRHPATLGVSGPLSPRRSSSFQGRHETATTNPSSLVASRIYRAEGIFQRQSQSNREARQICGVFPAWPAVQKNNRKSLGQPPCPREHLLEPRVSWVTSSWGPSGVRVQLPSGSPQPSFSDAPHLCVALPTVPGRSCSVVRSASVGRGRLSGADVSTAAEPDAVTPDPLLTSWGL